MPQQLNTKQVMFDPLHCRIIIQSVSGPHNNKGKPWQRISWFKKQKPSLPAAPIVAPGDVKSSCHGLQNIFQCTANGWFEKTEATDITLEVAFYITGVRPGAPIQLKAVGCELL